MLGLLVDQEVYPWATRAGHQLLEVLSDLYPTSDDVLAVAVDIGLRASRLNPNKSAYHFWRDVLAKAATAAKLRALVEYALADNPGSGRRTFLQELLTEDPERIVVDARPGPVGGAPAFLSGGSAVGQEEALLFHDDLTISIGRLPSLIEALGKIGQLASAVCKIVSKAEGGSQVGTGFLVAPDLILTNWHVFESSAGRAYSLSTLFGFEADASDSLLPYRSLDADVATVLGNPADDWAVLKLAEPAPDTAAVIRLSEAAIPSPGEQAFIIQHPGGEPKRIAYARNTITEVNERVVHYLSDTQGGSSGSPVLNAAGRIVALHHVGGVPQQVVGRPPLIKNEGIRIDRVVEQMRERGCAFL